MDRINQLTGNLAIAKDSFLNTQLSKSIHNKKRNPKELKKACQQAESLFLNMMLKQMRKTIPKGGLFPESLAKDIYTSMFDQKLSEQIALSGKGIGLAEVLYNQLKTDD